MSFFKKLFGKKVASDAKSSSLKDISKDLNASQSDTRIFTLDFIDDKFKVGQIWKYKTREGEEDSRIQILKIDKFKDNEPFIHISIHGLKIKSPASESGYSETVGHLPFDRKSFDESVTELEGQKSITTDHLDGYQTWKEAFEAEKAGVFTISIAKVIAFLERSMNE